MNKKETIDRLVQASPLLAAIGQELSFTKAAERLGVDQSAVSHRIRSLEQALGLTLFDRTTRQLRLTEVGEILCHAATDTLGRWGVALDKLARSHSTNTVHLSLPSSLAMKWLIPALPKAQAKDLDISVTVSEETVDFMVKEADAAIRFGPGPYPGLHCTHLSYCWLWPVASPAYLAGRATDALLLSEPNTTFLADQRGETDKTDFSWHYYCSKIAGVNGVISPDQQFDRADLMLQGAVVGMGVGLGRTLLVEDDIEAGYLSCVARSVRMRSSYWLVCSASFAETARFERLRDWLISEMQITREKIQGT
ncbi:LysR family transcriptional regulator [Sinobacterium caligoides]|nr:LysR family transcriptional regulator [Sinobacterium caligoides]